MSYVLGSATITNIPWREQFTVQGDSFYTLAAAYGVPATKVRDMQPGLQRPLSNRVVQDWIKSLPGWSREEGLRPYVPGDNPGTVGPDGRPEGWAQFTNKTRILLPDMPRLDGRTPGGDTAPRSPAPPSSPPPSSIPGGGVNEAGIGIGGVIATGAILLAGGLLLFGEKKRRARKRKSAVPAPVVLG